MSSSNQYVAEKRCCSVCDQQKVCHVCREQTLFACSDCRMNFGAVVYVCAKTACRDEHERKCFGTGEPDDRRTRPAVETRAEPSRADRVRAAFAPGYKTGCYEEHCAQPAYDVGLERCPSCGAPNLNFERYAPESSEKSNGDQP